MFNAIASKAMESISEALKEAYVKEGGELSTLQSSMEVIENCSLESLKIKNELMSEKTNEVRIEQIEKNRVDGANREALALQELKDEFLEEDGYKIEREQCLRNENGNIVKDLETGEARRIDFLVTKEGEVIKSIEVTSEKAPKDAQIAKEDRIREAGGNFIKDRDSGQLVKIPNNIRTEVRRYS